MSNPTTLLPGEVRTQLAEALKIDPEISAGESADRTRALESILFHCRIKYPHLFWDRARNS